MKKLFFYLAFALIAVTAGCEITAYAGEPLGVAGSVLTFTLCFQIYGSIMHVLERRKARTKIAELEDTLSVTRQKLDELTKKMDSTATAQNKKIVSQLAMLEQIMREQAKHIEAAQTFSMGEILNPLENADQSEILAAVKKSLSENRMDFLLQPTVSLPQRKVRFYESFTRLRTAEGIFIPTAKALQAAADAGLTGQIDTHQLFNAVHIARRLKIKHRDGAIFCNFSPMTLRDMKQLRPILDYLEGSSDIRDRIIFEMPLDGFLHTSPALQAVLQHIKKLGFALSIDHVNRLDIDFRQLSDMGVKYFKVSADLMLNHMTEAHAPVAAEDLRTLLSRNEIMLIAEKVEKEKTVLQLLDYRVSLAQGYLFGAPRLAREDTGSSVSRGTDTQDAIRQVG